MSSFYRGLLFLYPPAYRKQFGAEMLAVFADLNSEISGKSIATRVVFAAREIGGLLAGAMRERLQGRFAVPFEFSFSMRRFDMRNGFRFPKATAVLMTLILGGVIVAIRQGEAISRSLPDVSQPIAPIHSVPSNLLPGVVVGFLFFYAAGLIGWAALFAMRRSGVHRLDEISAEQK